MSTTPFLEETARRRAELRRGMFLAGLPRTLTAEEANIEFDFDTPLETGWSLKLTRDETVEEGFGYSFIDPEGWELFPDDARVSPTGERYSNIVFNEAGEAIDYTVTTPEGETYTLAEMEALRVEREAEIEVERVAYETAMVEWAAKTEAEKVALKNLQDFKTAEGYDLQAAFSSGKGADVYAARALDLFTPEQVVEAQFGSIKARQIVRDVFPNMTPQEFDNYYKTNFDDFVRQIQEGGYTEEKEALLRQIGYSPEEIDSFYVETPQVLPAIPPEGITYTVTDKDGEPLELLILEDFVYVGTERRLRSEDYLVFHEGTLIGKFLKGTGEFVPQEPSWWEKTLGIGAKALEYAFYPAAVVGQMTKDWWDRWMAYAIWLPEEERERRISEWKADMARRAEEEGLKQILPGGTKYEEFRDLPWYQQLLFELPVWIAIGASGLSAIRGRAALAPLAARPGVVAVAPKVARVALAPIAGYEWLIGKTLTAILGKPIQWVSREVAAFNYRQTPFFKQVILPGGTASERSLFNSLMFSLYQINLKDPKLAKQLWLMVGREAKRRGWGAMPQLLATVMASAEANPAMTTALVKVVGDATVKGTIARITPAAILAGMPTGIALEKTTSLIAQLVEMGHTTEAIVAMAPEEAWANLFKAPVAEVAPPAVPPAVPTVPPAVPAVPEAVAPAVVPEVVVAPEVVPAVPEIELYRTTRGFEEDAVLRTELETEQGYKLHAVFETPTAAQTAARELIGQDIRFVKHISTTGVETFEVYAKPPAVEVPQVARINQLRTDITRIEGEIETGVIPRAMGNAQLISVRGELARLEAEVAKPPIKHRGTEPEGIAIADELGLRYDGIQEELGMQFTDVAETGTSFYARTVEEARTTLADKRTAFAKPPVEQPIVVEKPSGIKIEETKQDTFIEASVGEDASRTTQDAIEAQSEAANLPPPNIPPGTVNHIGGGGNNSENNVYDMTNRVIPGEDAGRAAVRLWSGTRKRMATETISWWKKGSQVLRKKGIGKADGDIQRLTKEDSYELFKALHGEADVPAELQDVFDDLKALLDQESSDMLAFDPSFSRVMMAHPDYFPRGWRPPTAEQAGRMRIGVKPGFLKPRIDATFTEMVEGGWEPISWNPYDMAALRRMAGTEYREGRILISRLKTFSKAIAARDAPIKGWRVPQVGPAFQGKPYVGADGKAYMTPRIAVPDRVADVLESVYGVPVEFRVAGVDIFKAITGFGAITKRVKLFGSLFQHVDFLTRDLITAFTPMGIRHALPLKFPALAARVTASAVSPSWRATLEARILSGEPLYSDSTITLKMVADAGWELGQDELLIRREVREQLEAIIKNTEGWEEVRWAVRRLGALPRFFEAGLFDGVYRESQAYALEHVIIPRLRRLHPTWTDEQIAGSSAEEVNKQFSTLAVWQSVLQQPAVREMARAFFFSFNESESWIRQATSAVKGKNARYWREYAIATFVALAIAANAINLISERKFLPLNRYVPISLGNTYSSMPWGIAYNSSFLSPRLPWNGRNGQPLYLDIVGQADTYLRWILDPLGALTARYNVLPRALMNQVNGRDFWGRELEDWDDRVKQVLIDLFAPIGAGNLLQVARLQWPPVGQIIPEAEGRIGIVGSFIQISGLNVRAEKTMDMLDRFAKESGLLKADGTPVESWDDLEPHQKKELSKNEDLQTELGLRGEAAVERQYPGAEGFAKLDELDQERITRGESLIAELMDDLTAPDIDRATKFDISRAFRNEVTRLKREIADRKAQVDKDFQLFQETGVLPDDPNQRALTEYYNIFEKAKKPSGVIDWDEVNRLEAELREKWTPEQESYVDRNIGLTEWGPLLQEFIDAQKTLTDSGYWDADIRDRKVFRYQHPEVEKILTGKFYNQKPIEEGAEKISLEWQDIYRQIDDMETGFKEQSDGVINALPPMEGVTKEDWAKMSADEKRDVLIEHEMELVYAENPGFWEDDQRRNAWRKGFVEGDEDTEGFVEIYLERAIIVRATSPMSAEAKLFLLDHTDFFKRGLDLEIWTDDGSDWNRPVLELQAKHRTLFEEYELLETDEERQALKDANPQWVDDMRRIEAYENDASEDIVEKWVERGKKIDEFEAGSSEALVWLLDNPDAYDWAIENKLLEDRKAELLEREPILRINVDYATEDDWYNDGIPDKHKGIENRAERDVAIAKERAEYLAQNTEYNRARYRRDAFGLKDKDFKPFPDELIETYVDYYVLPKKPDDWLEGVAYYEDEWFLQDNPEFHQALVDFGIFKELVDLRLVPTREIFEKWWIYNTFTTQYDRDAYRLENPDLDEWGSQRKPDGKVFIWKTTMSEQRRRARITPSERFLEDVAEASQKLKDIMGRLGAELR